MSKSRNSAPATGMALAKEGQRLTEQMEDGIYTAPASDVGVQGGAQAVQFRRKFLARDAMDDEMNTKLQLMDDQGMTPFGQVYYDERVGKWLERKSAVLEATNFDTYFNKEFNKNDLASRQLAQQLNPDFYNQREREFKERADMVVKLKSIQLRGPSNAEELYTLWLLDSGRVKLPVDWDRIAPGFSGTDMTVEQETKEFDHLFQGMFRMPLFLSNEQRKTQATQNKAGGYFGSPDTNAKNFFGPQGNPTAGNVPLSRPGSGDASTQTSLFLNNAKQYFK